MKKKVCQKSANLLSMQETAPEMKMENKFPHEFPPQITQM